jgi:hypothetical protein
MSRSTDLDRFLATDPQDGGCEHALELLHVYATLVADDAGAAERHPEIAAHLRACGPCAEDLDALLEAIHPAGSDGPDG